MKFNYCIFLHNEKKIAICNKERSVSLKKNATKNGNEHLRGSRIL